MLHTSHPVLPSLVARCFAWKTYKWNHALGDIEWVDTGGELVSLPHFSYGYVPEGWDSLIDDKQKEKVLEIVRQLAATSGRRVHWRWPQEDKGLYPKVSAWLNIEKINGNLHGWTGNLGRKIRRAQKIGFVVETGGINRLNDFYKAYEIRMHQLGSAALPLFFFRELILNYPDVSLRSDCKVYVIYTSGGRIAGGAISLFYGDFCENTWFATLAEYQPLYPSYLLHAVMIHDAIQWGCRIYSFGRSTRGGGTHLFKQQWGTYDVELSWIKFPQRRGLELKNYPFLLDIWKSVPLSLARKVNPLLSKRFY